MINITVKHKCNYDSIYLPAHMYKIHHPQVYPCASVVHICQCFKKKKKNEGLTIRLAQDKVGISELTPDEEGH